MIETIPAFEQYLRDTILPDLERGRPGWDMPHTEQVVQYVKNIVTHEAKFDLDLDVLIVVAYLHDYGYMSFKDELVVGPPKKEHKEKHAEKSLEKWSQVQDNEIFDCFTDTQKDMIGELIVVHDNLGQLKSLHELVFMEADTLGAISLGNYQGINTQTYAEYLERVKERRLPLFVTKYGIREIEKILNKLKK